MSENTQFVEFLLRNKSRLLWGALFAVLGAVLIARITNRVQSGKELAYIQADTHLEAILRGEENDSDLVAILHKHKELYPKYDGHLAQSLLNRDPTLARIPAERLLERTGNEAGVYAEFSRASLNVAEGDYQAALAQALALKEKIGQEQPLLEAHNLLRIALLHQELGNMAETAAWEELLSTLESKEISLAFSTVFAKNGVSLTDYANERLKKLCLAPVNSDM